VVYYLTQIPLASTRNDLLGDRVDRDDLVRSAGFVVMLQSLTVGFG